MCHFSYFDSGWGGLWSCLDLTKFKGGLSFIDRLESRFL